MTCWRRDCSASQVSGATILDSARDGSRIRVESYMPWIGLVGLFSLFRIHHFLYSDTRIGTAVLQAFHFWWCYLVFHPVVQHRATDTCCTIARHKQNRTRVAESLKVKIVGSLAADLAGSSNINKNLIYLRSEVANYWSDQIREWSANAHKSPWRDSPAFP